MRRNALLTARGSSQGSRLASGGVIQVMSGGDVQGICESKFNVSGGTLGLVNILGERSDLYVLIYLHFFTDYSDSI